MSDASDLFAPIGKYCLLCHGYKPFANFYFQKDRNAFQSRCKMCAGKAAKDYYKSDTSRYRNTRKAYRIKNRDIAIARSQAFYYSKDGKAKVLLKTVQNRSMKKGWRTDLTLEFIENLLLADKCVVTGIPFVHERSETTMKHPFAPSLDRIDSAIPYLQSNVRLVIWQYNLMKGEISDHELLYICKKVVDK